MLTVGSLFSGIGGIEYGLERTGGFKTIWQCEIEAYPSAVLRKHWPDVPNLGDITKVDWNKVERPDLLCGGFPCQDISIAGKGKGIIEGERSGLWREFARAIRTLRPKYALVENVPELANRGLWLVLADLAEMGYDAEWQIISAASVGAPHKRERIFVIAHTNKFGCNSSGNRAKNREGLVAEIGQPKEDDSQRQGWKFGIDKICSADAANHERIGSEGNVKETLPRVAREFERWQGISSIANLQERPDIPKPLIRRGDDGFSNRMERTKCLGNAVVPQVAEVIGRQILEMEGI